MKSIFPSPGTLVPIRNYISHKATLHLNWVDLDDEVQWDEKFCVIKKFVETNGIDLIILDRSGDPVILDRAVPPQPSDVMRLDQLLTIAETKILVEDWHCLDVPRSNTIWFPYNLWLLNTMSIGKCYPFASAYERPDHYKCSINKSKPMMCLNRNPVWHRIYLLAQIYNKPWFDQIEYSFSHPIDQWVSKHRAFRNQEFFTETEFEFIEKCVVPLTPKNLSYEQGTGGAGSFAFMYFDGGSSVNLPVYNDCAINLITETSMTQGRTLTEKTFKALYAYQIPVLIAPTGSCRHLESLGFDMFSDYVPWKAWDRIPDPKKRITAIVDWVDKIMQSPKEIIETHKKFHQRLINNRERFFSMDLTKKLESQLSSLA